MHARNNLEIASLASIPFVIHCINFWKKLIILTPGAGRILNGLYKKRNRDGGLKYMQLYYELKDSGYSTQKLSQLQALAHEEASRQEKIESEKLKIKDERKQNIEYVILSIDIICYIILFLVLSHSVL